MFRIFAFLRFFFSATNQHGVHSPFVYALVTKCLYTKSPYKSAKNIETLLKCLDYFKVGSISVHSSDQLLRSKIHKVFSKLQFDTPPYDLIYFSSAENEAVSDYLASKTALHNDTLVFVDKIYDSRVSKTAWNAITRRKDITVSIDLFHCGLLFFRKEQAKEHFKIRI